MNSIPTNPNKLSEIVVVSGKGGTGKTTITSSLAETMSDVIMVDADVEAANWHLLLKPDIIAEHDFTGNSIAVIREDQCVLCGRCAEMCRFEAIHFKTQANRQTYTVDDVACEGCGLCQNVCNVNAVKMEPRIIGQWFHSTTQTRPLIYARLEPGGENSGHLVTKVKQQARQIAEDNDLKTVIVDGPPGIGCPVIAALSGAHFVIVVTEPTISGLSDLGRILKLIHHFRINCGVVINRFDINPEICKEIKELLKQDNVPLLSRIPHSYDIVREISNGRLPVHHCPYLKDGIDNIRDYLIKKNLV